MPVNCGPISLCNTRSTLPSTHGHWFVKRDTGDGSGGVASNAGQSLQGLGALWKPAVMLFYELSRALMQHARPPVIAQAAPGRQHGVLGGCRERLHIRKTPEENPVVVKHGSHACLLQHDFAEPDAVGFARLPPRKVASMLVVPAEQCATKGSQVPAG